MIASDIRTELSRVLDSVAEELDVPPGKYEEAETRYQAVCEWLGAEGSELAKYDPQMSPQGSFALGTAIRPVGETQYDVDVVCLLSESVEKITQEELKRKVGDRLKAHQRYGQMLTPPEGGRRCWTLQYADESKFHLDFLPAIPDPLWYTIAQHVPERWAKHAIQITDKTTWNRAMAWPRSNPRGYAEWFTYQMRVRLAEERQRLAMARAASIEDIPDYAVRTPLQRLVQILKRHRDIRYGCSEHRPISIIITTLAGLAYGNEASLSDAIESVVPKMRTLVAIRGGSYWIPNPVNPAENFADRWATEPEKARVFFEWLTAVERDYRTLLAPSGFSDRERYLAEVFGEREAVAALKRVGGWRSSISIPAVTGSPTTSESRFDVRQRERPPWPIAAAAASIPIRGTFTRNGSTSDFLSDGRPLSKRCDLMFFADGSAIQSPFEVYWQVVNTGPEAASVSGGLRGQILRAASAGRGGLRQKESTAYTGSHWVQCFIVKDGRCVGHSREFVVNIE